jgi:hypothetical protein
MFFPVPYFQTHYIPPPLEVPVSNPFKTTSTEKEAGVFNLSSQSTVHSEVQKCEVSCSYYIQSMADEWMNDKLLRCVGGKILPGKNRNTRRNTCPSTALYTTVLHI